jgi:hypothetical protein
LGEIFKKPLQCGPLHPFAVITKQALFCAFCGFQYTPTQFNDAYIWYDKYDSTVHSLKEIEKIHKESPLEFKNLREQIKEAMAYTYKIHFSVAEKYLAWFVKDFMETLSNNDCFKYIDIFKVINSYIKGKHFPEKDKGLEAPVPIIVVYLCLIPGTKEEKNKILDPMIQTLVTRYGKIASKIALRDWAGNVVKPRYSYQINDLIYIAGGNGDDKNEYVDAMKKVEKLGIKPINDVKKDPLYTDDYAFITGYEYEYKPKQVSSSLETALALLKTKLLQLAKQLK